MQVAAGDGQGLYCTVCLLVCKWGRGGRQVVCIGEWYAKGYWTTYQSERQWNMEFLKSLVPAVISGEGPIDHSGAVPRDTGPRLLSMKRLGLLVMGQTIDEDPEDLMIVVEPGTGSSRPARSNRTRLKGTTDSPGY